jgi:hypothetical protein
LFGLTAPLPWQYRRRWQHGRMYTARRMRMGLGKPGPVFWNGEIDWIVFCAHRPEHRTTPQGPQISLSLAI